MNTATFSQRVRAAHSKGCVLLTSTINAPITGQHCSYTVLIARVHLLRCGAPGVFPLSRVAFTRSGVDRFAFGG